MSVAGLLEPWIPPSYTQETGAVVVLLLGLYLIGGGIYYVVRKIQKNPPQAIIEAKDMPVLQPVPIPTKRRWFFMRALVWIYEVRKWELVENWEYKLSDDTRIIVEKGFRFDGASIPRPLWAILSPIGLLLIPALIHDYAYRFQQLWKRTAEGVVPYHKGRKKSHWDWLFWKVGREVNGTPIISLLAFLAVWLGGYSSWWRSRRRNEEAATPTLPTELAPLLPGPDSTESPGN